MQESKEIAPHITTKEELDALYKNIKESLDEKERPDQDKIDSFSKLCTTMVEKRRQIS